MVTAVEPARPSAISPCRSSARMLVDGHQGVARAARASWEWRPALAHLGARAGPSGLRPVELGTSLDR